MIKDSQGKEMIDFWDYMHKKVKITLNDGEIFIGYPDGYSSWADSGTGKDMIDLDCGHKGWGYAFPLDDIKTIEELKED